MLNAKHFPPMPPSKMTRVMSVAHDKSRGEALWIIEKCAVLDAFAHRFPIYFPLLNLVFDRVNTSIN